MRCTDLARAGRVREVPYTHHGIDSTVRPGEDQVEEFVFLVLQIPAQRIAAQIGHLNHACQLAVDEQGRFNDVLHIDPKRAAVMELLHQLRVLLGDRLTSGVPDSSM
jgi:hypothetical protein